MFCKYCGNNLSENSKFCTQCGARVEEDVSHEQTNLTNQPNQEDVAPTQTNNTPITTPTESQACQEKTKTSGKSIAGFVLSLVGLIFAGIPCGIIGVIFSAIGLKETSNKKLNGKGLAIAGLIISIIDIVGAALFSILPY